MCQRLKVSVGLLQISVMLKEVTLMTRLQLQENLNYDAFTNRRRSHRKQPLSVRLTHECSSEGVFMPRSSSRVKDEEMLLTEPVLLHHHHHHHQGIVASSHL